MKIVYHASLPPNAGAIKIHGEGGLRITLDVPESDVSEALKIALMRGELIRVTNEIVPKAYTPAPDEGPLPFDPGQVGYERTGEELLD